MAGVRIRHTQSRLANKTLTLVDGTRPYPRVWDCPVCGRGHGFKTYHLKLDDQAATIVSVEIVERLKRLEDRGGFLIGEEVKNPPAQRIVIGGPLEAPPVVQHPTLIEPR